jgi:hypothetical protein
MKLHHIISPIVIIIACIVMACSTGKAPIEVSVAWSDNFGNEFVIVNNDIQTVRYKSVKTGNEYEVSPDGFMVTAPDGTKVRIKAVE